MAESERIRREVWGPDGGEALTDAVVIVWSLIKIPLLLLLLTVQVIAWIFGRRGRTTPQEPEKRAEHKPEVWREGY